MKVEVPLIQSSGEVEFLRLYQQHRRHNIDISESKIGDIKAFMISLKSIIGALIDKVEVPFI